MQAAAGETFAALKAEVRNWRWAGVPFYPRTGKRMSHRRALADGPREELPIRAVLRRAGERLAVYWAP